MKILSVMSTKKARGFAVFHTCDKWRREKVKDMRRPNELYLKSLNVKN